MKDFILKVSACTDWILSFLLPQKSYKKRQHIYVLLTYPSECSSDTIFPMRIFTHSFMLLFLCCCSISKSYVLISDEKVHLKALLWCVYDLDKFLKELFSFNFTYGNFLWKFYIYHNRLVNKKQENNNFNTRHTLFCIMYEQTLIFFHMYFII